MKHLNNFELFSINEQRTLTILDEIYNFDVVNEGFENWIKTIVDFFEKINDSIRNLMLTMMEKGFMALNIVKKFFDKILDKIKYFKEKHPVLFRAIIITLVLIVILFVLCSAAATKSNTPPEGVMDAAIGFLKRLQIDGSEKWDNSTLMKAQAYLFELKKGGQVSNPVFGKEVVALANGAIKTVQQNVEEINKMVPGEERNQSIQYLIDLAEKGSKLISYKIIEYQNTLTGKYSGENINLGYK